MSILWLATLGTALLSWALMGGYRRLALARGWVDKPNHRSSHSQATPRGAGIVFAALIGAGAMAGAWWGALPQALAAAVCAGLGIAAVGWWDDLHGLSARRRFVAYWLIALAALAFLAVESPGDIRSATTVLVLLGCSVALQWLINLYNFMDGINGIAALEAIFVICVMLWFGGIRVEGMSWLLWCSLAALCGFLLWNFPLARVFMGDAGSAFLGFLLGLMMLWSAVEDGSEILVWLILLGVFVVDSTYTLAVRIATGQAWYQGHRLHAYQILTRRLGSHARVVMLVLLINSLWLLPWAWAAHVQWVARPCALALAYLPLIALCCVLGAGNVARSRV